MLCMYTETRMRQEYWRRRTTQKERGEWKLDEPTSPNKDNSEEEDGDGYFFMLKKKLNHGSAYNDSSKLERV